MRGLFFSFQMVMVLMRYTSSLFAPLSLSPYWAFRLRSSHSGIDRRRYAIVRPSKNQLTPLKTGSFLDKDLAAGFIRRSGDSNNFFLNSNATQEQPVDSLDVFLCAHRWFRELEFIETRQISERSTITTIS